MLSNYPMGADTKNAPWNKIDPDPVLVDCYVSYCISKSMPVVVNNYSATTEVEYDTDDEGNTYKGYFEETDFDNTNFLEEFNSDSSALGIPSLLEELKKLTEEKLAKLNDEYLLTSSPITKSKIKKDIRHYELVLDSSKGWTVDDIDVGKE